VVSFVLFLLFPETGESTSDTKAYGSQHNDSLVESSIFQFYARLYARFYTRIYTRIYSYCLCSNLCSHLFVLFVLEYMLRHNAHKRNTQEERQFFFSSSLFDVTVLIN